VIESGEVEAKVAARETEAFASYGLFVEVGSVEKGGGGDIGVVEAATAPFIGLDDGDFESGISGEKGASGSGRSTADDYEVVVEFAMFAH